MTVTVRLTGNAATTRFVAAVLHKRCKCGKKRASKSFPHIAQFSTVGFQQYAKGPSFFQCIWEGWPERAAVHGRTQEGCTYERPFWMVPQLCIFLLCSLGLTLLGWLPGVFLWVKGFCYHNWQSTIAADTCLPHLLLSRKRISIFSKVNQKYTHTTAYGPLLTSPLAFHSCQEQ